MSLMLCIEEHRGQIPQLSSIRLSLDALTQAAKEDVQGVCVFDYANDLVYWRGLKEMEVLGYRRDNTLDLPIIHWRKYNGVHKFKDAVEKMAKDWNTKPYMSLGSACDTLYGQCA